KCYRNGQTVATEAIATTGDPTGISLQPDRAAISADGRDVSMVTVAVVDSEGRTVPIAKNAVTFSVSGEGRIIGVGNGNPGSHEDDRASVRSVFNGLAQVIVQSTGPAG